MRRFKLKMLCAALVIAALPAQAAERVKLVASFTILADFAKNAGGDRVSVTSLVGADGDAHVYAPSPSDAKKIAEARLLVVNGLGFEGWLPRLVQSSGGRAHIVEASKGVAPRKPGSHVDPHAWQSVANAKIYAANIRDALVAVDPEGADIYRGNTETYLKQLDVLEREVRNAIAAIPEARRKVISTHDAFGYFAEAYGVAFIAPQGVSTDSEASARDVAAIIRQIRAEKIPAVFLENVSDPRLMRRIAAETGARLGGALYSDSLTGAKGDAPTYIDMVRHNIRALTGALAN